MLVANTFINQVRGKKNSPAAKPVNWKSQVAFSRSTQQKDSLQNVYLTTQQTTLCKQKRSQIFTIAKTGQTQTGCNRFMFASQLQNSLVFFILSCSFFPLYALLIQLFFPAYCIKTSCSLQISLFCLASCLLSSCLGRKRHLVSIVAMNKFIDNNLKKEKQLKLCNRGLALFKSLNLIPVFTVMLSLS